MTRDKKNNEKPVEAENSELEDKISEEPVQQDEQQMSNEQIALYEEKINQLSDQVKELNDRFLRKAAEFENYKRRTENDQFNLLNYAAENFIVKLLPVIDDFERSLDHIRDAEDLSAIKNGIKLVYDKLMKILNDSGVKKIESVGKPFNVQEHDALLQQKDDSVPPHTVIQEIEKGYVYKDKVIRHAKVIVSEETSTDNLEDKKTNSGS